MTGKALRASNAFLFITGIFAVVLAGVWFITQPVHVVRVSLESGDEMILRQVQPGTPFSQRYIHSVAKCPIIEKFIIDEQFRMVLMESWNCSFGAGIATEPPPGATDRLEDGFYVIDEIEQEIPVLYVHAVSFTDHHLRIDHEDWNLSRPPFVGETIKMEVAMLTKWHYWWSRLTR